MGMKGNICGKDTAYLDFYGCHTVISVGHSHPVLIERMSRLLSDLMFYPDLLINTQALEEYDAGLSERKIPV